MAFHASKCGADTHFALTLVEEMTSVILSLVCLFFLFTKEGHAKPTHSQCRYITAASCSGSPQKELPSGCKGFISAHLRGAGEEHIHLPTSVTGPHAIGLL